MAETQETRQAITARIQEHLATHVAPRLAEHEGGIELKDYADGVVQVYFRGACAGCPGAMQTLEEIVQAQLTEAIPQVQEVVIAQDISPEMLDLARKILNKEHKG